MHDSTLWTKRAFLEMLGAGIAGTPRLLRAAQVATAPGRNRKFTPLDCTPYFTSSAFEFGSRGRDGLIRTPSGNATLRGVPFALGPADPKSKSWIVLSTETRRGQVRTIEIPAVGRASFVCLAQFCDWDPAEHPQPGSHAMERVGQLLGEALLLFENGEAAVLPIRRRFEVNSPSTPWGHLPFAAVPHRLDVPSTYWDPLPDAREWGDLQTGVWEGAYGAPPGTASGPLIWLAALRNPHPERQLRVVRLEAKAADPLVVCGVTLFHGREHPFRYERLTCYRATLPAGARYTPEEWEADVDLGIVARQRAAESFQPEEWLAAPFPEYGRSVELAGQFFIEVAASRDATLSLRNRKSGESYQFDLGALMRQAQRQGARIEVLETRKVWLHASVVDRDTGRPTPARIAFRSQDGRYIPPYGHRTEINNAWFQDYGGDLRLGNRSYAYVDGTFQVELPTGAVYVEVLKGFEYEPLKQKLEISAAQRELKLEISRFSNLRAKNWASADTHVHFLSPSTGLLEAQAEDLNLINLLAAQWGDLFTNVGDLSYGPVATQDGQTVVWPGTENRQHILGHIGLLGGHGAPVFPMSASGPGESYIGTPLWSSLAEWADRCREREGLAVAVHFPYPTAELAADIALNKIDAVELWPVAMGEQFNNLRFQEWYRYLNCGYRLPAVSGTDKMSASIEAGAYRSFAYLGEEEFSFGAWARAVRKGNTFMSSGPLLTFDADGRSPGEEIAIRSGGGSIEVRAEARSAAPIHRLEVIVNGAVAAAREERSGSREMVLRDRVNVSGPAWIAARCASRYSIQGRRIAAHTSPVYVTTPDRELFSAPVAAYMLTLIDGAETWAKTLATRPDPETFDRVLRVFQEARDSLHQRLHRHGVRLRASN